MVTITSRFTAEELHEMAIEVVNYNNEIADVTEVAMFSASSTKGFYTDQFDIFLMEIEDGSGKKLIEINKEELKAMFVLYENVADALKLEKK